MDISFFQNLNDIDSDISNQRLLDYMNFDREEVQQNNLFNDLVNQVQPVQTPPQQTQINQVLAIPNMNTFSSALIPGGENYINTFNTLFFAPYMNYFDQPRSRLVAKKEKPIGRINLCTIKLAATTECSICLQDIKKNSKIPKIDCKHEFHKKCLTSWLKKKRQNGEDENCPFCRLRICGDCN